MSIPANIQQNIFELLAKTSNISFASAEGGEQIPLNLGDTVTAEVLNLLSNNRAEVSIGRFRVNLDLPIAVKNGQSLELTFVSKEPRATFALPRPGTDAPPVKLSDASRLLAMLLADSNINEPGARASLAGISDLLRQNSSDESILSNVLDEVLTYEPSKLATEGRAVGGGAKGYFESSAAQILQQVAKNSRFVTLEALNTPANQLPLTAGDEVDARITGHLPNGRTVVQIAGAPLEFRMPQLLQNDGIVRLTFLSHNPRPTFALPRALQELQAGTLSDAARWLSVLEQSAGGLSPEQGAVLEKLNTIMEALPPDSPVFSVIRDEPMVYGPFLKVQSGERMAQTGGLPQDDMSKLLQALIKGDRLAMLEALRQHGERFDFAPGTQLRGEVLTTLGGGRFLLEVAGRGLDMLLPKGTKVGERLNLVFISAWPNASFIMLKSSASGDSEVTAAARWISGIYNNSEAAAGDRSAAAAIKTGNILLNGNIRNPAEGASIIKEGIAKSGIFYESHLSRWFEGEYTIEDLLKEPQGMLSHRKQLAPVNLPENQQAVVVVEDDAENRGSSQVTGLKHERGHETAGDLDPRIRGVVQEQLASLQRGELAFRFDGLKDSPVELKIKEEKRKEPETGEITRGWETSLSVELPKLGLVNASIRLTGESFNIMVTPDNADSAAKLATRSVKLAEQFRAAGLNLGGVDIIHE